MALRDPVDQNLLRMEGRRFAARCETVVSSIERADTLREVSRLATSISLPYSISEDYASRDALRLVQTRAEGRARELIQEQLQNYARAEEILREKQKRAMLDSWANLTGPLGHLRAWAQSKLMAAEQQIS
jgi:CRISPR/Cas system-associated protein Csm6